MNGCDVISDFLTVESQEVSIPVPWGTLSGKWWGPKSIQPIIAIHGWQDNAGSFDELAPLLVKAQFSVLAVDLPGHGLSSHYPRGQYYYVLWDGLQFVRRIVKYYDFQKITLIGHSLGGAISFLYSAVYPDEVEKYISIDMAGPCLREYKTLAVKMGETVDKFLKYESYKEEETPNFSYDEAVDILYEAYNKSLTKESCKILLKRGIKPNNGGYSFTRDPRLKVVTLAAMNLEQTLEMASYIKCEVLNIRGDPGLDFEKPEYYDLILDKVKEGASRFERHYAPGSHHLHLNDARSVNDIIIRFLRS